MMLCVLSSALLLLWVSIVKAQGECCSRGSPDCDSVLGNAACKAYNMTNPGSRLPQYCDSLMNPCSPPLNTCMDIHRCNSSASSGYYQIQTANGSLVQVYCDMEGANCGGEGGWTRVFRLNMTDPSSQCPAGFSLTTQNGVRFCTRSIIAGGCTGIDTDNYGHDYTQVCGFVRGYAYYAPGTFDRLPSEPLSGNYVDGVSITYGTPLNHLWTYAAGLREELFDILSSCPCNSNGVKSLVPSYVGSDYYCESGVLDAISQQWYTDDPLWDGMQCGGTEGPCCTSHPTLPWFNRTMVCPTNDDILMRVCLNEQAGNENIGLERVEIYVK